MIYKMLSPFAVIYTALTFFCFPAFSANAAEASKTTTITDLKQSMGKNHFWMTMHTLAPDDITNIINEKGEQPAGKCLLTYIEKPRFRKKIQLAFILSAEKDRLLIQSGSSDWHLKPHERGTLNFNAGHWTHHFTLQATKENEITGQMPAEEMRSLLNTISRNQEGTLEFSSGKAVSIPLKNIAGIINDFKMCARDNHLANLGPLVPALARKGLLTAKDQAPKAAAVENKPF